MGAATLTSTRRLLELVQSADACKDPEIVNAAASCRSWLVFVMNHRTTSIPSELTSRFNRLEEHFRAKQGDSP